MCGSPFFGAIETLFGHTKTNASKREETDAKSGRRQRNMKAASFLRSEGTTYSKLSKLSEFFSFAIFANQCIHVCTTIFSGVYH